MAGTTQLGVRGMRVVAWAAVAVLAAAAPAGAGNIQIIPITNDADSGISSSKYYSHAIDGGTNTPAAVNGVGFTQGRTGSLPGATWDYQANSGSRNEHGGNAGHNVTGAVTNLFQDMIYNGNCAPGGTATVTLSGLTPGAVYETRLYARQWGASATPRQVTVGFDANGDGTPDNWIPVNQDDATSVGLGAANQAYAISYKFTAQSDHVDISLRQALNNESWHMYGVTNEIVQPAPGTTQVRGLMTADNQYRIYLSNDDSVLGTPIGGSGGDWNSAETLGFLVPTGQQMFLHVVAVNADPPGWGGLIGQFDLPSDFHFDETGLGTLDTNALLWSVNDTGFGNAMVDATSGGLYGIAPWGTGVSPALTGAEWIWMGSLQGQQAGTLYFSAPITVQIPEPATIVLVGTGLAGLLLGRRRRKHA